MSSNRNLSITIISILILSAFTTATVPMTSAISDPYIIVYPSSVSPGQTVYVRGYNFESGETVEIYCDVVDEYHHLGSATVNWFGRFYFSFVMQESYPGICNIIAVTNPDGTYSEDIELSYTNPLDQRLVNLIGSQSIDIEAKLDTILERIGTPGSAPLDTVFNALSAIYGAVDTMEADLESWMTTNLKTNIDNIWTLTDNTHGWGNLANALDDIKSEIITIDDTVDNIWGKVDTEIGAIKAKTDTINWADINNIGNWLNGWFGTYGKYRNTEQIRANSGNLDFYDELLYRCIFAVYGTAKVTITIHTEGIGLGEYFGFRYKVGTVWLEKTIAFNADIWLQTYEFCLTEELDLYGLANQGTRFTVEYSYVVEYQP